MIYLIVIIVVILVILFMAILIGKKIFYNIIDRRVESFHSELMEKQLREIENMYHQIRSYRHDYRNHINNMKIQFSEKNYEKIESYLNQLAGELDEIDTVIKTGNVMADAILNSKLSVAEKMNIKLNVKAGIPDNLPLTDVELCSILGNMLDNAIEANQQLVEEKRFIRVYIGKLKGQFYLSIQNASGQIKRKGTKYFSTKKGEHGYGLIRIDRIVKKYGGYVNRQNEDGIFATEIMIPLK